ncbi:MAG: hypothetical protein ACK5KN_07560 [Dysgonomonas sp.]|uniref:hypothetical protein n=1 Tax=Dysgonomonas sp. TaxID=1891233 RepID=UPI003A8A620E
MADIQFEYASNFQQNEVKYQLVAERLNDGVMYFTQNTLLQFFCSDLMCEMIDISIAIKSGESGDYLYRKAIELCAGADAVKEQYETSGVGDKLSEMARKITQRIKSNENR